MCTRFLRKELSDNLKANNLKFFFTRDLKKLKLFSHIK